MSINRAVTRRCSFDFNPGYVFHWDPGLAPHSGPVRYPDIIFVFATPQLNSRKLSLVDATSPPLQGELVSETKVTPNGRS
ncbi:hypothetical protein EVAR_16861_1 [Eumeta japonica]|uniref:Uncharacterized protein n=1 Tax=Eumeta variegata TaxID=151549 RepID=A0A4C1V1M2_EUMVA|nr:hypothetical protein EVAR_16861_1 [Eumeta japonica]